jgi:Zn-finger protein
MTDDWYPVHEETPTCYFRYNLEFDGGRLIGLEQKWIVRDGERKWECWKCLPTVKRNACEVIPLTNN